MIKRLLERRHARALQSALERYERAIEQGTSKAVARAGATAELGPAAGAFLLATGLREAASAPDEVPAFAERFSQQLRTAEVVRRPVPRVARRFVFAPAALAATVIAAASVLIPAFNSLPGDGLYAVKGASEDARVFLATGVGEANVRLQLADKRFDEVQRLIDRSQVSALGVQASALDDIKDPRIARLIEATLREASRQIEKAANILIAFQAPAKSTDLDRLVSASVRGQNLVTKVADGLPHRSQPPVLQTAVKFAKIEAKAKAARTRSVQHEAQLAPCDTPTPSPTPTESPDAQASAAADESTQTVEEAATPSPTPTQTPSSTPCITPKPTATPDATPTPDVTPEPTPEVTEPPADGSVDQGSDGQDGQVDPDGSQANGTAADPSNA